MKEVFEEGWGLFGAYACDIRYFLMSNSCKTFHEVETMIEAKDEDVGELIQVPLDESDLIIKNLNSDWKKSIPAGKVLKKVADVVEEKKKEKVKEQKGTNLFSIACQFRSSNEEHMVAHYESVHLVDLEKECRRRKKRMMMINIMIQKKGIWLNMLK